MRARGTAQCEEREDRIRCLPLRRVSVDAKASWNKINASSRDGTLFVATSVDATAKAMQRNALYSVISQTFRGAGTSVARVLWTAQYARSSARGSSFVQRRIPIAGAKGQRTALNRYSASSRAVRVRRAMQARSRVGAGGFCGLRGRFAHAHYRFRKRALLVPFRCDSIARGYVRRPHTIYYYLVEFWCSNTGHTMQFGQPGRPGFIQARPGTDSDAMSFN